MIHVYCIQKETVVSSWTYKRWIRREQAEDPQTKLKEVSKTQGIIDSYLNEV